MQCFMLQLFQTVCVQGIVFANNKFFIAHRSKKNASLVFQSDKQSLQPMSIHHDPPLKFAFRCAHYSNDTLVVDEYSGYE